MEQLYIVVTNDRWNLVTLMEQSEEDFLVFHLKKTAVIRYWGTKRDKDGGLGWLARDGIRDETILDREPDGGQLYKSQIIRTIPCNMENKKWKNYLMQKQ